MEKIKIKVVDEVIYHERLENGLDVYVYKKPGFQKKSAFFQTKYGSLNNDFVPINKSKMKSFPLGIAHFLEHKLFESSDDANVFEAFEKNGAYVNAATSLDKTYYYFSAPDHFYDNLKLLLDMVQSPYFTDENVEKEKGIIGQEIDMYDNNPDEFLYSKLFYNLINGSPLKYNIAGTKKSVKNITKDDLYECYNTFYHPSNMFLVVVGDVLENKVISFVKENQKAKKFPLAKRIIKKEYEEKQSVETKEATFFHNVVSPKIGYAYKLLLPKLEPREDFLRSFYVWLFMSTKFNATSGFNEQLIKDKLVKSYFNGDYVLKDNILVIYFIGDVIDDAGVRKRIEDALRNLDDLKAGFDLYRKSNLAGVVRRFESPDAVQSFIRSQVNNYGFIFDDVYELYKGASYDDYLKFIKTLNFDNSVKVIIKSKEE
ncbi:MAG: pitrilysin family protein [Bacilli bacterium]|nr:pitrilysin family protein [Bacilli bacterium]